MRVVWKLSSWPFLVVHKRWVSGLQKAWKQVEGVDGEKIRNIGVIAHIDAGKTTTTERMLFYSGMISYVGEVHKGDTVTDYMEQERTRGITITSAAVTFPWQHHRLNLVDTPGHVDFGVEVERSLRVLDGAICVMDASAGVQAQTKAVWRQSEKHEVPKLIFLNKMDKEGASLEKCLRSVVGELGEVRPLVTQFPIGEGKEHRGVVQLENLTAHRWDLSDGSFGKKIASRPLCQEDGDVWLHALSARQHLVESVTDVDDALADVVLTRESLSDITAPELTAAIRRVTLSRSGVPTLVGSAYKNVGVQPLMDAVVAYLPSPLDRPHAFAQFYRNNLCALVFKVLFHKHMGALTFLRIFSGSLHSGQKVYNVNRQKGEKLGKLMVAFADEFQDVDQINSGNIAVVTGLKETITGDTITSSASIASAAQKAMEQDGKSRPVLAGIEVPQPVFFCSIEPSSLGLLDEENSSKRIHSVFHEQAYQKPLETALSQLEREDPSLHVKSDADTGQTVLMGMGQLHLGVIQERIRKEFRVEVDLGPLQVAYRERLVNSKQATYTLDKRVGDSRHWVKISLDAIPDLGASLGLAPVLKMHNTKENRENLANVRPAHLKAIQHGIESAITSGPLLRYPVIQVEAQLHWLEVKHGTSDAMISSAAAKCFSQALLDGGTELLEPTMRAEVEVNDLHLRVVLADLSQRRSKVEHVGEKSGMKVVHALVPLAELSNYANDLRTITSGMATFSLEFSNYSVTPRQEQEKIMRDGGIM